MAMDFGSASESSEEVNADSKLQPAHNPVALCRDQWYAEVDFCPCRAVREDEPDTSSDAGRTQARTYVVKDRPTCCSNMVSWGQDMHVNRVHTDVQGVETASVHEEVGF